MKIFKRLLGVVLALAVISLPFIVWANRQPLQDWYRLRDYTPPPDVVALADSTTMNNETRRLFYINRPDISDKDNFNQVCSQEASIVLGCYVPGTGIFLYRITDTRLKGVMEVTAAHETLHAAYERLGIKERQRIDQLTAATLTTITDKRVLDTIQKYRDQDAGVVPNELHSILATEVRNLPPELEQYYKRYFNDRLAIVSMSEHYEGEFSSRQATVAALDAKLAAAKKQIETSKTELTEQFNALEAEKNRLDNLRASGDIATYNDGVAGFNTLVGNYNSKVRAADLAISNYNKLVEQRNSVALEVQGLAQAIDSRPQKF